MGHFGQGGYTTVEDMMFRIYTEEEIKKISVLQITNDQSINELGHVARDGLYDLRMGPMCQMSRDFCETCKLDGKNCRGHCGHIELPLPLYNPLFYSTIRTILSTICTHCYMVQAQAHQRLQLQYQTKLLDQGYGQQALEVQDIVTQHVARVTEADEVTTGTGDREIKRTKFSKLRMIPILETSLQQFCDKVNQGGSAQPDTSTSNIKALQVQIFRNFITESRARTWCKFCRNAINKFSFQGSRFMTASSAATLNANKQNLPRRNTEEEEESGKEEEEEKKEEENKGQAALKDIMLGSQSYITTEQAKTMLREVWKTDNKILECIFPVLGLVEEAHPTDIFFLSTLLVLPPKLRPCNRQEGMLIEHETSVLLKNMVRLSKALMFLLSLAQGMISELPETLKYILNEVPGNSNKEKVQTIWYQLQGFVDNLFDADLNKMVNNTTKGVRQVIEKKAGLFRSNLMGKRVNYSARSVAAPDPQLAVNEVGVPMDFAIRLSYPVPVTQWNVDELRQLVINGPNKYPGAMMVEDEEGKKKRLTTMDLAQRTAMANKLFTPQESHVRSINATKIVYRHLMNGDYVLMNRQPTLHKPSIQAHRARVMPNDRVLRMPYANCKAYNADFDGDELNLHFPQNEIARSESKYIITTCNNYLTPKDGSPLAGLIQDCVVASVMLTVRGKFFSREDYQQLLVNGLTDHVGKIRTLPPAILKPQQLWSGKQVISTLLLNIIPTNKPAPSFTFRTSVKVDLWQTAESRPWLGGGPVERRREAMTDSDFVMREGELMSGVIDKSAIGSTSHGLVHVCYDLYSGDVASQVLTAINRLCCYYLKWSGHTISVKEFVTPPNVSAKRRAALKNLVERAPSEVSRKLGIPPETLSDHFEKAHMSGNVQEMAAIDAAYTSVLGPTTSEVTGENERGLLRRTLDNHMRMMVDTGAKGSKVNMNQMASLFGSVAIDGKRMPISLTGKFLPSFPPYTGNPRGGGYIPDRFMTGINPQSYFYLCIVGRDSLQHTAVKTADSGYMQRCLIKHLEGIHVKYDMTVRNSDGLVLQFDYGEDGLDVTKTPFLRSDQTLEVVVANHSCLVDPKSLSIARSVGEKDKVDAYAKKLKKWHKKNTKLGPGRRGGFLKYSRKMAPDVNITGYSETTGRANASSVLQRQWNHLEMSEKEKYLKNLDKCPDPVKSMFSGASNLGVVSEALDDLINRYYEDKYSKRRKEEQKLSREEVAMTVHMKSLNSMVDPGEAVGALCAQALGEPLTQMTLNTFHFAGRDELNVTLGVPRMKEILKTATKNLSTPIMEVPFLPHINKACAEALRLRLTEVSLYQVLHGLNVTSELHRNKSGQLHRRTRIRLSFLPGSDYKRVCAVTPHQVLLFTESHFLPKVILKDIKKSFRIAKAMCSSRLDRQRMLEAEEEAAEDKPEKVVEEEEGGQKKGGPAADDDDDDEEEDAEEDGDATSSHRNKKQQEQDYSDPDDDDDDDDDDDNGNPREKRAPMSEDEGIEEDAEMLDEPTRVIHGKKRKRQSVTEEEFLRRHHMVMDLDDWITDYTFDKEKQLWCQMTLMLPISGGNYDIHSLVMRKSKTALVHSVQDIKRAFVVEKDQRLMLRTEGVNILKLFEYEHLLEVKQLYTNNIHKVAEMYGIEAAQRSIIREIRAVQSAYDIKVDFRHLSLLSDYFTCEGVYKACSRQALVTCRSPLQQMSYETTTAFLKTALLSGTGDLMNSPTANVAVGQPIKLGTNSMEILPIVSKH